jgi:thioredoxin-like negative regulator of GroEL
MREEGAGLLARSHEPADHLRMAEALRQGGALREASELIEAARLRFGASAEVVALLALTWVDRGHPRVAARLLEQRAGEEPERWLDAAELYRRAGDLGAALRANSAVLDQPAKVRQRVGLLVQAGRLHEVAALVPRAERLGLLGDDAVRYALAWGCLAVGELARAETLARGVRGVDLFERAVALVGAVLRCRAEPEACP